MLGFLSGEWRGVHGAPRRRMYAAIVLLLVALAVMAAGLHRFYRSADAGDSSVIRRPVGAVL
jgi:hypothetical protein